MHLRSSVSPNNSKAPPMHNPWESCLWNPHGKVTGTAPHVGAPSAHCPPHPFLISLREFHLLPSSTGKVGEHPAQTEPPRAPLLPDTQPAGPGLPVRDPRPPRRYQPGPASALDRPPPRTPPAPAIQAAEAAATPPPCAGGGTEWRTVPANPSLSPRHRPHPPSPLCPPGRNAAASA